MPSVLRQKKFEQVVGRYVERWKTKFVSIDFPWLWAVRQNWDWSEKVSLNLTAEIIEKSETFQGLLELHAAPEGELWGHYFWGDGRESVTKVDFTNVDWSKPNALIHAIWNSNPLLPAHIALLKEEDKSREVTVFRTKHEWGMNGAFRMMIVY